MSHQHGLCPHIGLRGSAHKTDIPIGRKLSGAQTPVPARRMLPANKRRATMLYTIAIVLILLWALGLVSSYTIGGFIHVLLVIAIVVILLRVISGRRAL